MGKTVPLTLSSEGIYYCVDPSTGIRRKGTPVTRAETGQKPDCTVTDAFPDILGMYSALFRRYNLKKWLDLGKQKCLKIITSLRTEKAR